jgi:hypothetical protein
MSHIIDKAIAEAVPTTYHFAGPGSLDYSAVIIKCVLDAVPPLVINENGVAVNHCEIMHSVSFIRGVFRSLGEE